MHARFVAALLSVIVGASTAIAALPPRNLDDAHRDLERWLGATGIQHAKKARSEQDFMFRVIGLEGAVSLTNRWHLWDQSPLARYFKRLGVREPHDMVGVVTGTYWCKVQGRPVRLREHAAYWREAEAKNRFR
ncbi:MAG TPA: DUF6794 domain-containing protein [Chthoniobacterales bacterium]|jgi:hypothetical protein|nr:DUF6794 domain-containing protein [Chthoniobacterales bacterium]